jgi:hypothetical protein
VHLQSIARRSWNADRFSSAQASIIDTANAVRRRSGAGFLEKIEATVNGSQAPER